MKKEHNSFCQQLKQENKAGQHKYRVAEELNTGVPPSQGHKA